MAGMGPLDWLSFGLSAFQDIGNTIRGDKYARDYDRITRGLQDEANQQADINDRELWGDPESGNKGQIADYRGERGANWADFRQSADAQIQDLKSETVEGNRAIDRIGRQAADYRSQQEKVAKQAQGDARQTIKDTIDPEIQRNLGADAFLSSEYGRQDKEIKSTASGNIARGAGNVWANAASTFAEIEASDLDPAAKMAAKQQAQQQFMGQAADQYNQQSQEAFRSYSNTKANLFNTLASAKVGLAGARANLVGQAASILDDANKTASNILAGTNTQIFDAMTAAEAQDFNTRQAVRDSILSLEQGELQWNENTQNQALALVAAARARGDNWRQLAIQIRGQQRTPLVLFNYADMISSVNQTRAQNSTEDMQATADRHQSQQFWGSTGINSGIAATNTAIWASYLDKQGDLGGVTP